MRRRISKLSGGPPFITEWSVLAGDTITLPTVTGYSYNATIDWNGEATTNCTAHNVGNSYTFVGTGTKIIKVSGLFQAWSFNNGGSKLKLINIIKWGDIGTSYLSFGFFGCTNLISLGDSPCTWLLNIWLDTFKSCTSITTIPNDFFKLNINTINFSGAFYGATALRNIPEDLFFYNKNVTTYLNCFRSCRNLILPSVLFDLSVLHKVTAFGYFMQATATIYGAVGTIQDIWNYTTATSGSAFTNQTSLTNYASIPLAWK